MTTLKAYVNGEWVRVGGGSATPAVSEVEIGPDDPSAGNPSAELWYDTDATSPTFDETLRWNTAWGLVASVVVTTGQATAAAATWTELTGSRVTFTALASRRYLISMQMSVLQQGAASGVWAQICDVTAGNVEIQVTRVTAANGDNVELVLDTVQTPGAVVKTYSIRLYTDAGTATTQAFGPGGSAGPALRVEDIGPVGSYVPVTPPFAAWLPLAPLMANGWANYGAPYGPCQYRKVGDVVSLRGLIQGGSPVTSTMFTLPVGYRPGQVEHIHLVGCSPDICFAEIRISQNGPVALTTSSQGATPAVWTSLADISFSTT
jgi:hypothetical protein